VGGTWPAQEYKWLWTMGHKLLQMMINITPGVRSQVEDRSSILGGF
jgi:hypothetical protein